MKLDESSQGLVADMVLPMRLFADRISGRQRNDAHRIKAFKVRPMNMRLVAHGWSRELKLGVDRKAFRRVGKGVKRGIGNFEKRSNELG